MVEDNNKIEVGVCHASRCFSNGSPEIYRSLKDKLKGEPQTAVTIISCLGFCRKGPNVLITNGEAPRQIFNRVSPRVLFRRNSPIEKIIAIVRGIK